MSDVRILDAKGQPMKAEPRPRLAGLAPGARNVAYDGADFASEYTAAWRPALWSPDVELNTNRDILVARARDLARNDGWASGAVTRLLDNAIGASFRPIAKPDHRLLHHLTGNARFDAVWAKEYAQAADAAYRLWANDHEGRYCDVERQRWMGLTFGVAFRHLLIDNDALAILEWRPERISPGRAAYATCVRLVDPDRLSNPQMRFDWRNMRGGVELDNDGVPIAYHIRMAHQGDWWAAAESVRWERVPRETEWGRPVVVHYFEPDRAAQHRGGNGVFTPVINRLKMLFKYDTAELDGAILNAIYAAIAESPFDHELMAEALGEGDAKGVANYQDGRFEFHDDRRIRIGGAQITQLYPGERLNFVRSERPNANFPFFEKAVLRNVAMAIGSGASQVSGDYSDVNFSSLRAEINEIWKTVSRRRHNFGAGFASPVRTALLEEAHERDEFPMPKSGEVAEFYECRSAFSRARWLGPGRGWVDPVAEKQGVILGMDAGLTTLEEAVAEYTGDDFEDKLDQRRDEAQAFDDRGLPRPTWLGIFGPSQDATQVIRKPEAQ